MKRYIKLKIGRKVTGNLITYTYPEDYNPELIDVVSYESFNPANVPVIEERGNDHEYLIAVIDDIHPDNKRLMAHPDCLEMDIKEIKSACTCFSAQKDMITDRDKVLLVLAKSARGEELTADDLAAIDPNHAAPGINSPAAVAEIIIGSVV